jgi:hypothetical protein
MADFFTFADPSGDFTQTPEAPAVGALLLSQAEIIAKLRVEDLGESIERSLIIDAEGVSFSDDAKPQLCSALLGYIERRRDSQSPDDLIAVGAAIRKLVASIPSDDIQLLAPLMEAGHLAPLPLELELEIAKMVVWKLSLAPPSRPGAMPELAVALLELAQLYLNDRLLPRKGYAATALNAVLALLLMRDHVTEVIELLGRIRSGWFLDLMVRRVANLKDDFERRSTASETDGLGIVLQRVVTEFTSKGAN